jgi:hypothetical protein
MSAVIWGRNAQLLYRAVLCIGHETSLLHSVSQSRSEYAGIEALITTVGNEIWQYKPDENLYI